MVEWAVEADVRRVVLGRRVVLEDVVLRVRAGETIVIGGPNGAGKTSLLRCILGLLPMTGTVRVGGHDVVRDHRRAMARVGYVPQTPALFPELTVREHLEFFAALRGVNLSDLPSVIQAFGIPEYLDAYPGSLSGGWLQRVSLALALMGDPPILVLDEPTAHLDRMTRDLLWETLRQKRRRGATVLMTTHRLEDMGVEADRVLWLEGGRLAESPGVCLRVWLARPPGDGWERHLPETWRVLRVEPDGFGGSTYIVLRGPWTGRDAAVRALLADGNAVLRVDESAVEG